MEVKNGANVRIVGLKIGGNRDGIDCDGTTSSLSLSQVSIQSGFIGLLASPCACVTDSIIVGATGHGDAVTGAAYIVDSSLIIPQAAAVGSNNRINSDPLFEDAASGNFGPSISPEP